MGKPILCLDFDGVLHSYESGWKGADAIPDPPVSGAMEFLVAATTQFQVAVFSSRSSQTGGIEAMKAWLKKHLAEFVVGQNVAGDVPAYANYLVDDKIEFPREKLPAMVTIDDRALTFDGTWPSLTSLLAFKPWNKRT